MKDKQKDAAEKLLYIWPNYLSKLAKDPLVPDKDKPAIKELAAATLIKVAHFMSKEPFTGLNTINNILRLFSFFTLKKF